MKLILGKLIRFFVGVVISTIVSVMSFSIISVMFVTEVEIRLSTGELGVFDCNLVLLRFVSFFPCDVSSHVSQIDRLPIVLSFGITLSASSVGIVDGILMIVDA